MKNIIYCCLLVSLLISCKATKRLGSDPVTKQLAAQNFNTEQLAIITTADASAPMRLFLLTNPTDSILLRKQSTNVIPNPDDRELQQFIGRLYSTVRDSMSLGVGIAAPQVGILKNIIWIQRFDKPEFPFEVYLNPVIKQYTNKKQPCMEGCLSIPNKQATTQNRAYAILIEYDKVDGSHHTEMVEDFTAVIFQHEIDHLNGIIFVDHLEEESNTDK